MILFHEICHSPSPALPFIFFYLFLVFYLLILERREWRGREAGINLLLLGTHSPAPACAPPRGSAPQTLEYREDALTNWGPSRACYSLPNPLPKVSPSLLLGVTMAAFIWPPCLARPGPARFRSSLRGSFQNVHPAAFPPQADISGGPALGPLSVIPGFLLPSFLFPTPLSVPAAEPLRVLFPPACPPCPANSLSASLGVNGDSTSFREPLGWRLRVTRSPSMPLLRDQS